MSLPPAALPDAGCPPPFRARVERYTNQGGLIGAFTYALTVLETDDETLAATTASIPTNLFVTSSLHDDAIDESGDWNAADRKRRLNERITLGDLVFTNVVEAVRSLPADADLTPVLETVRQIGRGQLAEDHLEPSTATLEDAVARVDARGAVWGDLAVALVDAVADYSETQCEMLRRLTRNGMFVLTVVDDVEDLPADVANGVANVPRALYDGDLSTRESPAAVVDAFLGSDAPDRLEAILAERRTALGADARAFAATLDRPETDVLAAVRRALSWYCDTVCSVPVEATVPPERQRRVRAQLAGDEASTRRTLAAAVAELPLETGSLPVDLDAVIDTVVELPAAPLADVLSMVTHVATIADDVMSTSLADALDVLERRASTPQS
ncbi:hypothetical protein C477_01440 [Haloterrigena salina JCM 13891]|uniref:Geranylgeranyl pyrophosphate synthase n=1 Tax=Haloterrigena salina JCM 13891 TaxID=1227488 RepID=M0CKK7_9EURY|nr:class 1 isoprenoid biosynthesis enzyme [Haloterrigena salina]ELZ23820.1 hypothetical protein C477_01440 [Haloterrigena salina JCM 13891]